MRRTQADTKLIWKRLRNQPDTSHYMSTRELSRKYNSNEIGPECGGHSPNRLRVRCKIVNTQDVYSETEIFHGEIRPVFKCYVGKLVSKELVKIII